jgi:hypothetical protein
MSNQEKGLGEAKRDKEERDKGAVGEKDEQGGEGRKER